MSVSGRVSWVVAAVLGTVLVGGCTETTYGYPTALTSIPSPPRGSFTFPSVPGSGAPSQSLQPSGFRLPKGATVTAPDNTNGSLHVRIGDLIQVRDHGVQNTVPPILVLAQVNGDMLVFQAIGFGTVAVADGPLGSDDTAPVVRITVTQ